MFNKKLIKKALYLIFSAIAIKLSSLVKISFLLGSKRLFLSATNIIAPMAGVFGGILNSLLLFLNLSLVKLPILNGSLSLIGYHIPHFFASFYWNSNNKLAKIVILLSCMFAFIAHSIGFYGFAYALLWLIPIFIALFNKNNIFIKALGSTFTAHAIGSVIWIYTVSAMNPQAWISLIPIAILERCVFASGMAVIYYAYIYLKSKSLNFTKLLLFRVKKIG